MNSMDEINLLQQAQRQHQHHLMVRGIGEEIDLEIGPGDDPSFSGASLVAVTSTHDTVVHADDHKSLLIPCSQTGAADGLAPQQHLAQGEEEHDGMLRQPSGHTKKKKKVVKKWREEWADTYKWAYVAVHDNTTRIFCSVCKEYGRKHRRNPYGNEGSRNMQMSALEEHNNSLLHKEALRLQLASKEKLQPPEIERPVYVKGWCCRLVDPASTVILEFHLGTDVRTRQCVINLFLKLVYYWDIPGNMLTFSFNCVLLHCKK
jgi:glutamate dehydrogenase (NADP+)